MRMSERLKRQFAAFALLALALQISTVRISSAFADGAGVVINEVAWAGTADGTNDEWIELYNPTNEDIDLSGWSIVDDDDAVYLIESGVIEARGYFLIEDSEVAVSNVEADAVIPLSLANTGDSLVLKDADGVIIDIVNGKGEKWYAGGENKATMERVDHGSGDKAENFKSAVGGNGSVGRNGGDILGTPGSVNSVFEGEKVDVILEAGKVNDGVMEFLVKLQGGKDVYAYSMDIVYDIGDLNFIDAEEGEFLKDDGQETVFESGLLDGEEGTLIIGGSRLINPAKGIDGEGTLAVLEFRVNEENFEIGFGEKSYVSDSIGKVAVNFIGIGQEEPNPAVEIEPVNGLKVSEGEKRYSLRLSWKNPQGVEKIVVKKEMPNGELKVIGETVEDSFVDKYVGLNVDQKYALFAVNGEEISEGVEVIGRETRGILGDIDRSDRVDGGDLEMLARNYGNEYGEDAYVALKDVNYDGFIDGNDLITIGVNFAKTY